MAMNCGSQVVSNAITEEELMMAVFSMERKKTPRYDGITAEILRRAWPQVKVVLLDEYSIQGGEIYEVMEGRNSQDIV